MGDLQFGYEPQLLIELQRFQKLEEATISGMLRN